MLQLFCSRQVPEEIRQFDVILEEPDHIYFCGEQISGHVKVDLAGCLTVQGMWTKGNNNVSLRWVKKVKESGKRLGVVQRFPGGLGSQIFMTFGT